MRASRAILLIWGAIGDYRAMECWWRRLLNRGDRYGPLRCFIVETRALVVSRVRVLDVTG